MDAKIINLTLRGQCVCCGKRTPECKNWEQCYERRLMGSRGFHLCALCGDGFGEREKLQHAGACLARYLRRVDELREAQAGDRLVASNGAAAAETARPRPGPPPPCAARTQVSGGLGDLPPSLAWMYPREGPSARKNPLVCTSRRPRPVTVTVKDKGVQAQEKLKDKATQTSAIELQPGQDVAYVRWTGVMQTHRPLLEADRVRIYALMENLRRAVADVLGGQEAGTSGDGGLEEERSAVADIGNPEDVATLSGTYANDAFASAEQRLDEIDEILRIRAGALERAMRGSSSSRESDDLAVVESVDGSIAASVGAPREASPVAGGESEVETDGSKDSYPRETGADNSFASALSGEDLSGEETGDELTEETGSSVTSEDSTDTGSDSEIGNDGE